MKPLTSLAVDDYVYLVQLNVVSQVRHIEFSLTGRIRVDTDEVTGANQQEFALIQGVKAELASGKKLVKDEYEEWHEVPGDVFTKILKWFEARA